VLKLRRASVVSDHPLVVEVGGRTRPAWADVGLVGEVKIGDEVIVNVEALDLGLGSGGFDVIHANLSRGLEGPGAASDHVMKLNYTSLQHPVAPIELSVTGPFGLDGEGADSRDAPAAAGEGAVPVASSAGRHPPVLVLPLHGHLAPAAWAAREIEPALRIGFVQTAGGALPGRLSRDVALLRERGLLVGDVSAGPAYGGGFEAMSVPGALDAGLRALGWEALIVGPGPGIVGSASRLGHGGMAALDSAHAALALGFPTLLSPRLSNADPRPRHLGLSHHTATVLDLLLAQVRVPVPSLETAAGDEQRAAASAVADAEIRAICADRHEVVAESADVEGYAASGLPDRSMGRGIDEDPLFFAAALAAGRTLGSTATPAVRSAP
jgi:hypothetical protein